MNSIITQIFDTIGFNFKIIDGSFSQINTISGYNPLISKHIGYYIPYLARQTSSNKNEVGVAKVSYDNNGQIIAVRHRIVLSSNNNEPENFIGSNCEFFIFANISNFNTGFNNIIVKDKDFIIEPIQSTFLVDSSSQDIYTSLPPSNLSENLVIEIKSMSRNNSVIIRDDIGHIMTILKNNKNYIKFVCDGNSWKILTENIVSNSNFSISSLSSESDGNNPPQMDFSIMSEPTGDYQALQYNNNGALGSAPIYLSSGNNNSLLFLGSSVSGTARSIIPISGDSPTIFNNTKQNSDFIVNGSGNRNLFFSYDGRLGLNIPSGSRPSTIFHVVNTICQEGFRLENRNACHPANMTLYHKPTGVISNNDVVSRINLSAKNSAGNKIDYSQIESIAYSTDLTKGQLNIIVSSGSSAVKTLQTNADSTILGYSGNNITIQKDGNTSLGYDNNKIQFSSSSSTITSSGLTVNSPTITLNASTIGLGSGADPALACAGTLTVTKLVSSDITMNSIAPSSILVINSANKISAASGLSYSNGTIRTSIPANKILSTTTYGAITGIYDVDDYFLTNQDITWNTYSGRSASIALRQVTLNETVPVAEFSVGDQISIVMSGSTEYRDIASLDISNGIISSMLLNQNVTTNTIVPATILSVTKGGYLLIKKNLSDVGNISTATTNIISIRPETDTVFNTLKKDINFSVYGLGGSPAISVKANVGRSTVPSGTYHVFATQKPQCEPCEISYSATDIPPFAIIVNSGGSGVSSQNPSVNFLNIASGTFSGMVTSVGTNGLPSYYGTYDQNGNAAEWIEDSISSSTNLSQFAAGGSWKTGLDNSIGVTGLRNITSFVRNSGYENIGFRIAAQYGITDVANISAATGLNLEFTNVTNVNNLPDETNLYLYSDNTYAAYGADDLGVVAKNYRIGKYEVTNSQYVRFLNAVATDTGNDRSLYDPAMSSSSIGGITRTGNPYFYSVKANMGNKPVVFVNYLNSIKYMNWLHNGAILSVDNITYIDSTINNGAYDILDVGNNSYLINKNTYQKYWLPNINEWHKAAYFEPRTSLISTGSSSVMIKRDNPYPVSTGINAAGQPGTTFANLSVRGWLYADHIIIGDGTVLSPKNLAEFLPPGTFVNPDTEGDRDGAGDGDGGGGDGDGGGGDGDGGGGGGGGNTGVNTTNLTGDNRLTDAEIMAQILKALFENRDRQGNSIGIFPPCIGRKTININTALCEDCEERNEDTNNCTNFFADIKPT